MMSPSDISKLSGSAASSALARSPNTIGARESSAARPQTPRASEAAIADKGVAVQTGARVSAGQAPVDSDRVVEIRNALRDGSYPIVPAKITDAMIAARLMLSSSQ